MSTGTFKKERKGKKKNLFNKSTNLLKHKCTLSCNIVLYCLTNAQYFYEICTSRQVFVHMIPNRRVREKKTVI